MRTTTTNWKKAFQRGAQQPIVVARIFYHDPNAVSPAIKSWDVSTDTIPGLGSPQTILSKDSGGIKPALLGITQIGQKLDPLTRTIATGDLSLLVGGREVAWGLVPPPSSQSADQTFYRKLVQVFLAHPDLTNPSDWLPIFHGFVEDVVSVGGDAIEFKCRNYEKLFEEVQWGGSLYEERPITQARMILDYVKEQGAIKEGGLVLDGSGSGQSFSPDNPDIAGTKSWAVTTLWSQWDLASNGRNRMINRMDTPLMEGFPGPETGAPYSDSQTVPAKALVDLLLRPYLGSIYIDGSGTIVFRAFHTTTDRTFSQDQYQDFEQYTAYKDVINSVVMTITHRDQAYTLSRKNLASRDKFGEKKHEFPNFPLMRSHLSQRGYHPTPYVEVGSDGCILREGGILGITGIKYSPTSVGELGYMMYAPWNEIFSYDDVTSPATNTSEYETWHIIHNADGSRKVNSVVSGVSGYETPVYLKKPRYISLDVTAVGVDSTNSARLTPVMTNYAEYYLAKDVTQWRYYSEKILDRFAAGVPTAKVIVDMSNADLELGDIVELDSPEFLWEGFTDADTIKWEIVSIEYNPTSDNPGISLDLCAASQSGGAGFTTHIIDTTVDNGKRMPLFVKEDGSVGEASGGERTSGSENTYLFYGMKPIYKASPSRIELRWGEVSNDITTTIMAPMQGRVSNSSLVPSGSLTDIGTTRYTFSQSVLDADSKYRVYVSTDPDKFIVQKVLKTSSSPFSVDRSLGAPVVQFTTDGSSDPESASMLDLRETGSTYKKSHLPAASGGANLDFEDWRSSYAPPDSWELDGEPTSWNGYFAKHTADSYSGVQCMEFNTAYQADISSKWIPCKGGETRRLVFYHKPTSATSKVSQSVVYIEQRIRDLTTSSPVSKNPSGSSTSVWYKNSRTVDMHADATHYRIILKRLASVTSPVATDSILLDNISCNVVTKHVAKASRASVQSGTKGVANARVAFDERTIDDDEAFVISGATTGLWFAPSTGTYLARWYITANACDNTLHYRNRAVQLLARTGNSSGVLSTTLSTTYLQTYGEDADACSVGGSSTFFKGDCVFSINKGDSFGLETTETSNVHALDIYGVSGGPTPGTWVVIESLKINDDE